MIRLACVIVFFIAFENFIILLLLFFCVDAAILSLVNDLNEQKLIYLYKKMNKSLLGFFRAKFTFAPFYALRKELVFRALI